MSQNRTHAYAYLNITLAAPTTTTVKSGNGVLKAIVVNKGAATGTCTIYDNTAASGTVIGTITGGDALPRSIEYNVKFANGLTIVSATAAMDLTVVYE